MIWFLKVSVFSMIPLLRKDNLLVPTVALMIIFCFTFKGDDFMISNRFIKMSIGKVSEILMFATLLAFLLIEPPSRYPDTWPLIISVISCGHILTFLIWGYAKQFT